MPKNDAHNIHNFYPTLPHTELLKTFVSLSTLPTSFLYDYWLAIVRIYRQQNSAVKTNYKYKPTKVYVMVTQYIYEHCSSVVTTSQALVESYK